MNALRLHDMTVDGLVDLFVSHALAQDEAILYDENDTYNRLYDEMEAIESELRSRGGDQRRALVSLFGHPNAQVRLKAAIATLALVPADARAVLRRISDRAEFPQAGDANGMLRALDEGRYVPT